jgi:hypothetical protein
MTSYPNVSRARREGDFETLSELGRKGAEARNRNSNKSLRSFYRSAPKKTMGGPERPVEQKTKSPGMVQEDLFKHHPFPKD